MKLRRGCGCPLLILLAVNFFFVIGAIFRIAVGPSEAAVTSSTATIVAGLFLFLANCGVTGIMTLAAFRDQPITQTATGEDEDSGGVELDGLEHDDEAPSGDT